MTIEPNAEPTSTEPANPQPITAQPTTAQPTTAQPTTAQPTKPQLASEPAPAVTAERRVEPLDPPMVPFAVAGMAAFAVAGVIVLLAGGPTGWRWICLAGVLTGIPGLLTMLRHDRNRRRRRALSHPDFRVAS